MKHLFAANAFVLGMGFAVIMAAIAPELGSKNGPLPVAGMKTLGIFAIFLLQGVSLPLDELRKGLADWKLHLCVQSTTFLFFPLIVSGALLLSGDAFPQPELRMGFLYFSFLPTTIASAIALTATSHGNVSGALFNTTISNVVGIFLVPFLCAAFLGITHCGLSIEVGPVLIKIALMILLPLLIGQCLRIVLRAWAASHKAGIRRFNNSVILFIVYAAFCDSFTDGTWSSVAPDLLIKTLLGVLALLVVANLYVWSLAGVVKLNRSSRVAALLCGSQKTLAVGLPLSVMIFGNNGAATGLSLIILPLLIYHLAQLILGAWLSPKLARYVEAGKTN